MKGADREREKGREGIKVRERNEEIEGEGESDNFGGSTLPGTLIR